MVPPLTQQAVCATLSPAQVVDNQRPEPPDIIFFPEYLQRAGFASITTHRLAHDIQNNWYVVMK